VATLPFVDGGFSGYFLDSCVIELEPLSIEAWLDEGEVVPELKGASVDQDSVQVVPIHNFLFPSFAVMLDAAATLRLADDWLKVEHLFEVELLVVLHRAAKLEVEFVAVELELEDRG